MGNTSASNERGSAPADAPPVIALVVDDEPGMIEVLKIGLEARGRFRVRGVSDPSQLDRHLTDDVDVVLTDLRMPEVDGLSVLERVRERAPGVEVLLMTAYSSIRSAVEAIRGGAFDYITKPFDLEEVGRKLELASRVRRLERRVREMQAALGRAAAPGGIIGECGAMRRIKKLIRQVAPSSITVLITGESGTGKELVARALHEQSPRAEHPFVAVNCAALPEALLESELFGHVRGAFTGATAEHAGLIAAAQGGTLFLDEIAELPPPLQAKLLRVFEDREVRAVGSVRPRRIDVRFVAATQRDLEQERTAGRFRQDLYHRLNGIEIALPPVRHRPGDVSLLAQSALERTIARCGRDPAHFAPATLERLERYSWPGNVREIFAVVERALLLGRSGVIKPDDLPEALRRTTGDAWDPEGPAAGQSFVPLDTALARYIEAVLRHTRGNVSAAAQILDVPRTTLISRMQRLGLRRQAERPSELGEGSGAER